MICANTVSQLYFLHVGEVRRFLMRRLSCAEVAAELAQETFVRFLARPRGDAVGNPRALLFRIAGNLAIDHFRAQGAGPGQFVALDDCQDLPSEAPGPERYAIARQQVESLRRAVEELPAKCRAVFLRHKFDGIPQADLAREYGVSRNAIEKHLIRALLHLRLRVALA